MKYFIDTEFLEPDMEQMEAPIMTPPVLLISIGIVSEDGREYYAQDDFMSDLDLSEFPSWHQENVMPYLLKDAWRPRAQIRDEVEAFINAGAGKPEFVFWCGCYDYVILCQLFGGMLKLPAGWPHSIIDLQQTLDRSRITDDMLPPQTEQAHNALADARYLKQLWTYMANYPVHLPFATLKEAGWPMWNMPQVERDRLMNGTWISDVKPLAIRNDPGLLKGGVIPKSEWATTGGAGGAELVYDGIVMPNNHDFVGTWHHGELIPKGDPRLNEKGEVRATGSDSDQAMEDLTEQPKSLEVPAGMSEADAQEHLLPPVTDASAQELQTFTPKISFYWQVGQADELVVDRSDEETKQ